jgi:hypothetical protein
MLAKEILQGDRVFAASLHRVSNVARRLAHERIRRKSRSVLIGKETLVSGGGACDGRIDSLAQSWDAPAPVSTTMVDMSRV